MGNISLQMLRHGSFKQSRHLHQLKILASIQTHFNRTIQL